MNYGILEKINEIYSILLHENNKSFYEKISLEKTFDDKKASSYKNLLIEYSLRFIVFHELGHIYNGHLKYLYYEKGIEKAEFHLINTIQNEMEPLFSQSIEMNADAFAATRCIDILTYDENIKVYNSKSSYLIKDKSHAYIIFYIVSGILFAELGLGNPREDKELHEMYYLPLRTRLDTMIRCSLSAYYTINKNRINDRSVLNEEFLREMAPNTEQYFNLLRIEQGAEPSDFDTNNNLEEISEEYIAHANEIFKYWSIYVRYYLLKYTIFELPH